MSKAQIKARIENLQTEITFLQQLREQQAPPPELTDEQAKVLEQATHGLAIKLDNLGDRTLIFYRKLSAMKMIEWFMDGCYWHITDTGRAALKAHQIQQATQLTCTGCGSTDNLVVCRAIPCSKYLLCPVCLADEEVE